MFEFWNGVVSWVSSCFEFLSSNANALSVLAAWFNVFFLVGTVILAALNFNVLKRQFKETFRGRLHIYLDAFEFVTAVVYENNGSRSIVVSKVVFDDRFLSALAEGEGDYNKERIVRLGQRPFSLSPGQRKLFFCFRNSAVDVKSLEGVFTFYAEYKESGGTFLYREKFFVTRHFLYDREQLAEARRVYWNAPSGSIENKSSSSNGGSVEDSDIFESKFFYVEGSRIRVKELSTKISDTPIFREIPFWTSLNEVLDSIRKGEFRSYAICLDDQNRVCFVVCLSSYLYLTDLKELRGKIYNVKRNEGEVMERMMKGRRFIFPSLDDEYKRRSVRFQILRNVNVESDKLMPWYIYT